MANKQTGYTKKYQEKVGLVSKSYKLRKELVEEFALACSEAGIPQSKAISDFMEQFINEHKPIDTE